MNRRGLLGAILAIGAAPAFASAGSLMKLAVPLDDAALFERQLRLHGEVIGGVYRFTRTVIVPGDARIHACKMMAEHEGVILELAGANTHISNCQLISAFDRVIRVPFRSNLEMPETYMPSYGLGLMVPAHEWQ